MKKILILGGIKEAIEIASILDKHEDITIIYSLAGRVSPRINYEFKTRSGGFGGVDGLIDYLKSHSISAVINATHPFAEKMAHHCHIACSSANIPELRYSRPQWQPLSGDNWTEIISPTQAIDLLPQNARVFLALGTQDTQSFTRRTDCWFLGRSITEPKKRSFSDETTPAGHHLILSPPYPLNKEITLFKDYGITHIVTKNSGGKGAYAKIEAARELKIPVFMIKRPEQRYNHVVSEINSVICWAKDI